MSGPKGYSYQVESAAVREQRELRQARDRCTTQRSRLAGLNAQLSRLGSATVAQPQGSDRSTASTQRWQADLDDAVRAAQERVSAAHRTVAVQELMSFNDTHATKQLAAVLDSMKVVRPTPGRPEVEAPGSVERQQIADSVARALLAVAELPDVALRRQLRLHAASVLERTSVAGARGELIGLTAAVNDAVNDHHRSARLRTEIDSILLDLPAAAPLAQALRLDATRATNAREVTALREAVDEQARLVAAAEDDTYVRETTLDILSELGYDVQELAEGAPGAVILRASRADLPDHALQLRMMPAQQAFVTTVVSIGPRSAESGRAAEELTCTDVESLEREMTARGVQTRRNQHLPPGARPVAVVQKSGQPVRRRSRAQQKGAGG